MNVKFPGFVEQWEWMHWVLIGLVILMTFHQVYKKQVARINQVDFAKAEVIEEDIKEYNTQSERLAQLEVLPPVKEQWDYVMAISDTYGVDVSFVSMKNESSSYDGPLASWTADLKGAVGAVLVVAKKIQDAVPTYLYNISLKNDKATIRISVLGSE